jgi:hypothetical protein
MHTDTVPVNREKSAIRGYEELIGGSETFSRLWKTWDTLSCKNVISDETGKEGIPRDGKLTR